MKTKLFIAIAFSLLLGATFILLSSDSDSARADVLLSDVPAAAQVKSDKELGAFVAKEYKCDAAGNPGVDCIVSASAGEGAFTKGKVSWFSDQRTASGISAASEAGVALNLRPGTRKGWLNKKTRAWMRSAREGSPFCARVTLRGASAVFPIIDLGPSEFTDRAIDLSKHAVEALGYSSGSFPTDIFGTARVIGRC